MRAAKPTTSTTTPRRFHLAVVRELHTGLGSAESAGASVNFTREPAWIQFEPNGDAVVAVAGGCPVARWDVRGDTEDVAALAGGGDARDWDRDPSPARTSSLVVSIREARKMVPEVGHARTADRANATLGTSTSVARTLVLGFHSVRDARDARARLVGNRAPNTPPSPPRSPSRLTSGEKRARRTGGGASPPPSPNVVSEPSAAENDAFTEKIDRDSAAQYFSTYARLAEQQNMLQDRVRTGTYFTAIMEHREAFEGAVVMDVGAGSGVLSCFAALAGARRVYAVEASDAADHCAAIVANDARLRDVVKVIKGRVESHSVRRAIAEDAASMITEGVRGRERDVRVVDVLVSEPMGTMLFNERMIESFLIARDAFLKPRGGQMFPRAARLHCAPFEDAALRAEIEAKAAFWNAAESKDFYGIDVSVLGDEATRAVFAQPCVDAFDPAVLLADPATFEFDFSGRENGGWKTRAEHLESLSLGAEFVARRGGVVHGVAWWFDVEFDVRPPGGETAGPHRRFLTTAPGAPTTHWFQIRLPLRDPLGAVARRARLSVRTEMVAGSNQSYAVTATVANVTSRGSAVAVSEVSEGSWNLKDPYYRQLLFPWPASS